MCQLSIGSRTDENNGNGFLNSSKYNLKIQVLPSQKPQCVAITLGEYLLCILRHMRGVCSVFICHCALKHAVKCTAFWTKHSL